MFTPHLLLLVAGRLELLQSRDWINFVYSLLCGICSVTAAVSEAYRSERQQLSNVEFGGPSSSFPSANEPRHYWWGKLHMKNPAVPAIIEPVHIGEDPFSIEYVCPRSGEIDRRKCAVGCS